MDASSLSEAQHNLNFEDQRISEMLFRYRARNFPDSLNPDEQKQWQQFRQQKFSGEAESSSISIEEFDSRLKTLENDYQNDSSKLALINELKSYRLELMN